jgi:hypothetical protein
MGLKLMVLLVLCGLFYHNVPNTIGGFQNRLGKDRQSVRCRRSLLTSCAGVFFFILALFGFSSLTTLGLFANERVLFMRER